MAFASKKDIAIHVIIDSDVVDGDEAVIDVIVVALEAITAALIDLDSSEYDMVRKDNHRRHFSR
jgi:hypothetical protein